MRWPQGIKRKGRFPNPRPFESYTFKPLLTAAVAAALTTAAAALTAAAGCLGGTPSTEECNPIAESGTPPPPPQPLPSPPLPTRNAAVTPPTAAALGILLTQL